MRVIIITLILILSATASAYSPPKRPLPVREYVNREYIVTAYTGAADENGGYEGVDYKSRPLQLGGIACNDLADGTRVMINGKIYVKRDIMEEDGYIDIYMQTKAEAFEWGRKKLIVQVIKEGN